MASVGFDWSGLQKWCLSCPVRRSINYSYPGSHRSDSLGYNQSMWRLSHHRCRRVVFYLSSTFHPGGKPSFLFFSLQPLSVNHVLPPPDVHVHRRHVSFTYGFALVSSRRWSFPHVEGQSESSHQSTVATRVLPSRWGDAGVSSPGRRSGQEFLRHRCWTIQLVWPLHVTDVI